MGKIGFDKRDYAIPDGDEIFLSDDENDYLEERDQSDEIDMLWSNLVNNEFGLFDAKWFCSVDVAEFLGIVYSLEK